MCQDLFFNKVAGLRPGTLLKTRLWHKCFLVNFAKFIRTPSFTEHLWATASVDYAEYLMEIFICPALDGKYTNCLFFTMTCEVCKMTPV